MQKKVKIGIGVALLVAIGAGAGVSISAGKRKVAEVRVEKVASKDLVAIIVAQLLGTGVSLLSSTDIAAAYQATGGNVRETLFKLYDVYQANERRVT